MSRNMPPNAAIAGWAWFSRYPYVPLVSGSPLSRASRTASTGFSLAVIPTMSSGNSRRMPNTAMATPTVRKIFCQNVLIRTSTVALTTALSNDSEISRMPRIATRARPVPPP